MPLSEELLELAARVSNWGRWGDDDERGTQNLIDAEATRRGVATVRHGRSFSLAVPLGPKSPQRGGAPGRFNPIHTMLSINIPYHGGFDDAAFNDDICVLPLSGGTHIDSLAHVSYSGKLYNGFPADSVLAHLGATHCGVDTLDPIVSRGVLLDLPATFGVGRLDPGHVITAAELDAALEHAKVTLEPGDVALVRTGQMQLARAGDAVAYNHESPGLSTRTIEWVRNHDLGAVFTDTYIYEVWPPEDYNALMVVHAIQIRDMGQIQGQNFDLEDLAADCADDGVYEFLFSASPEPITGGCSAPVNPVVVR